MNSAELIAKALERLDSGECAAVVQQTYLGGFQGERDIAPVLVALIKAAADSYECNICGGTARAPFNQGYKVLTAPIHAPDCALLALCRALTEGGERARK